MNYYETLWQKTARSYLWVRLLCVCTDIFVYDRILYVWLHYVCLCVCLTTWTLLRGYHFVLKCVLVWSLINPCIKLSHPPALFLFLFLFQALVLLPVLLKRIFLTYSAADFHLSGLYIIFSIPVLIYFSVYLSIFPTRGLSFFFELFPLLKK